MSIQLTNNIRDDEQPKISGDNVVWSYWNGSDYDLYLYNGDNTIGLSEGYFSATQARVSGNNVVWQENALGGQNDVYLYQNGSKIKLTGAETSFQGYTPRISGNNVVWSADGGKIFFYNGTNNTLLVDNTGDSRNNQEARISGNKVVWQGLDDGNDYEIYLYNGTNITKLTNNNEIDDSPSISGNNVVWNGWDGNDYEIFFYDGVKTTQLTNNNYADEYPLISGNNVVWGGKNGDDYEIFFYNGTNTIQLTNNSYEDFNARISGNNVVWRGYDGSDFEIFAYNGSSTFQLTNNNYDDRNPDISDNNVVWEGKHDNDYEIFLDRINNGGGDSLLDTPFNRFQSKLVPGTYLFANETESQSIIANYSNIFELEGFAFKVATQQGDGLVKYNRFRNKKIEGTYLFADEAESVSVIANFSDTFELEGTAFYAYGADANKGSDYYRLQNTQQPGTYIFVGEEEKNNILANFPQFSLEGVAFEVG